VKSGGPAEGGRLGEGGSGAAGNRPARSNAQELLGTSPGSAAQQGSSPDQEKFLPVSPMMMYLKR